MRGAGVFDDHHCASPGQSGGEGDRTRGDAGVAVLIEVEDVPGLHGSGLEDLVDGRLGQQQPLGDAVADRLELLVRVGLLEEPVVDRRGLGDQPVAELVGQGEVLPAAVGRGRIEDHPVLEEGDAVAGPAITASLREVRGLLDLQVKSAAEHRDRVGGESGANLRREDREGGLDALLDRSHWPWFASRARTSSSTDASICSLSGSSPR